MLPNKHATAEGRHSRSSFVSKQWFSKGNITGCSHVQDWHLHCFGSTWILGPRVHSAENQDGAEI
jgi:hypothetical protein